MIKFNAQLPVSIFREGKYFIAYTPVLDLSTSGKDYEQVKKRFHEVVSIFFEELVKKGTLEKVLGELGWTKTNKRWSPPTLIVQESERINVAAQ